MTATSKVRACMALACILAAGCASCSAAGDAASAAEAAVGSAAKSAARSAESAAAEVLDELPLQRGYYVRTDATCATASNATMALVRRTGITDCDFTRIERIGASRYRVEESCAVRAPPPGHENDRDAYTQEYEILGEDRYRVTYEYGETVEFHFCPQQSLSEMWRDNDISDLIE